MLNLFFATTERKNLNNYKFIINTNDKQGSELIDKVWEFNIKDTYILKNLIQAYIIIFQSVFLFLP